MTASGKALSASSAAGSAGRGSGSELPGRVAIERVLGERLARLTSAPAGGPDLGLILVVADHLDLTSERFGLELEQKLLEAVARGIQGVLGPETLVGHWSRHEFVAVIDAPGTTAALVDALRARIAATVVRSGSVLLCASASIGAASACPGDTPGTLLARADLALRRARAAMHAGEDPAAVRDRP